ncbi:N-acetylglutaminylglutamine synthetase [Pseudoxanthobacter sp. M-2]|uniref:N-acetylglutaminylglutamine synthetase n=1 Tax=Pseudoxanthobacter sp. M-2 TaxID=3078754 RepID=UPI0038FBFDCD
MMHSKLSAAAAIASAAEIQSDGATAPAITPSVPEGVCLDCGWGRLLFSQTFADANALAEAMRAEGPGRRDIAFYVRDPHVLLAAAPHELFLDPSHAFRLRLADLKRTDRRPGGFTVRRIASAADADGVNRIYAARGMVPIRPDFFWGRPNGGAILHLVAEDDVSGAIVGTVTGIDHARIFDDPDHAASLWCLAVDPQAPHPGIGEALVRHLCALMRERGAVHLDLSVMHDNEAAIGLYEQLGFERLPVFAVKRKNPINEKLFAGPPPEASLNPYARIIVEEARRRGIGVDLIDAEGGLFRLIYGGRSIACRESLSDLTSAVALSICDDKAVTRRIVERAGVRVPEEIEAGDASLLPAFLERHGSVVVKPARGEQGRGVAVGLTTLDEVEAAVERARGVCDRVLVESCFHGDDLRLVVIDYRLVAAAIRRPAAVVGDGRSTVRELIARQSRRREAATGGESSIPLDAETERCVAAAGLTLEDIPDVNREVTVRKAANLHTGGTIHDVTDHVHPTLVDAAVQVARAIGIPVVGVDFIVRSPHEPDYVFIEANERPGLANHEPQPTAERFVDLLFPQSMPAAARDLGRDAPTAW